MLRVRALPAKCHLVEVLHLEDDPGLASVEIARRYNYGRKTLVTWDSPAIVTDLETGDLVALLEVL